jgi:hypothetical protein
VHNKFIEKKELAGRVNIRTCEFSPGKYFEKGKTQANRTKNHQVQGRKIQALSHEMDFHYKA